MTKGDELILARGSGSDVIDLTDLPPEQRLVDPETVRRLTVGEEAGSGDVRGLRIMAARLDQPLDLGYSNIERPIAFVRSQFAHAPNFARCRVPGLDFVECELPGLRANSIDVAYTLAIETSDVSGPLSLVGAKIGADLAVTKSNVSDAETALDFGRAAIGANVFLNESDFSGTVELLGASIGGALNCTGVTFSPASGPALYADIAEIKNSLVLTGVRATGEIRAVGASVGDLVCSGATVEVAAGDALTLDGARIAGNAHLDEGFSATGAVRFISTSIKGSLMLHDAALTGKPSAFIATRAEMEMWFSLLGTRMEGGAALIGAQAAGLIDDLGADGGLGSWRGASPLHLSGFEYQRFASDATWDTKHRFEWLRRTESFDPRAWRHLVDVYRAQGRDDDARRAAIAGENDRLNRAELSRLRRIGRWILRLTIGHGYRPLLAGAWAAAFIASFALFVGKADSYFAPEKQGVTGEPQALVYSADVFLPIVDLTEAANYAAKGEARWAEWSVILVGWTLTTLFVAGFTRAVRS